MKKILSIFALLFGAVLLHGAAAYDVYINQRNAGNTAAPLMTISPAANSFLFFNGSKVVGNSALSDSATILYDVSVPGTISYRLNNMSSATFLASITDATGSAGVVVGSQSPTLTTPTFSGVVTSAGAVVTAGNPMGALAMNVASRLNTKTISADSTLTFSGTPATDQWTSIYLTNSDTAPHAITVTGGSPAAFTIAASSGGLYTWRYNGATWLLVGGAPTVNDLSTITPVSSDLLGIWDVSAGIYGKATLAAIGAVVVPTLTATYVGYGDGANALTGEAAFNYTAGSNTLGIDTIQLGATGVNITNDTDGAITFLGTSTGSDEDLTLNLDDTANTVSVTSSTGVVTLALGAIGVTTTGTSSIGPLVDAGDGTTPLNNLIGTYGVGTAYALTNTAAAVDFGTTDPVVVLTQAGTYTIYAQINVAYNAATVVAETAAFKVRRTNNTAADLSVVVPIDLPVSTTLTHTYGVIQIPPFSYTTASTSDSITIFANVSAGLGAGTIDATAIGTSIIAIRRY